MWYYLGPPQRLTYVNAFYVFSSCLVNGAEKMPVPNLLKVALQQHLKVIHDFSVAVRNLEDSLKNVNSVGDDAQLANVDLQDMLQKQQQTLQMLSNIDKELYDTAMAVIRKIGG
jgi:hypothetical protein